MERSPIRYPIAADRQEWLNLSPWREIGVEPFISYNSVGITGHYDKDSLILSVDAGET